MILLATAVIIVLFLWVLFNALIALALWREVRQ